jgi:hypothetical protein
LRQAVLCGLGLFALFVTSCADKQDQPEKQQPDEKTQAEWDKMVGCLATNDSVLHPEYHFYPTKECPEGTKTTVKAKLRELGALVQDGKVYDVSGEELYFYRVYYWVQLRGRIARHADMSKKVPYPPDPDEEIKKLEKRYHVVPMFRRDTKD